jgi:hypothetical protein
MGAAQIILLVVVAVVVGAAAQLAPGAQGARTPFDGIVTGLVALGVGFLINVAKPIGPSWDGLHYLPAVAAEVVWAAIVALLLRKVGRKEPVY